MSRNISVWKKFVTVTIAAISIIGFGACGSSNNSSSVGELDQIKEKLFSEQKAHMLHFPIMMLMIS